MIYRAVLRPGLPLRSPTGEPTRGTFTFCKMLFALAEERKPSYFAMAVDAPRKSTWRRALFPGYKAKRDEQPATDKEILIQVHRIKEVVEALGVAVIGAESFEADDVIATLVEICASDDVECVVCSRDKDLHQLVGPNCRMYDPQEREWANEDAVEARWGVPPEKVVEIQTLAGDTTDNVPGVRGIGLKKALDLIRAHGSVAGVMKAAATLSPSVQKSLAAADLKLCRQLVELRRDVPLNINAHDLEFDGFNMDAARPLFRKLGFRQWS